MLRVGRVDPGGVGLRRRGGCPVPLVAPCLEERRLLLALLLRGRRGGGRGHGSLRGSLLSVTAVTTHDLGDLETAQLRLVVFATNEEAFDN